MIAKGGHSCQCVSHPQEKLSLSHHDLDLVSHSVMAHLLSSPPECRTDLWPLLLNNLQTVARRKTFPQPRWRMTSPSLSRPRALDDGDEMEVTS